MIEYLTKSGLSMFLYWNTLFEDPIFYIQKYASSEQTQFSDVVDFYPRPQTRPYQVGLSGKTIKQKLNLELSEEKKSDGGVATSFDGTSSLVSG